MSTPKSRTYEGPTVFMREPEYGQDVSIRWTDTKHGSVSMRDLPELIRRLTRLQQIEAAKQTLRELEEEP